MLKEYVGSCSRKQAHFTLQLKPYKSVAAKLFHSKLDTLMNALADCKQLDRHWESQRVGSGALSELTITKASPVLTDLLQILFHGDCNIYTHLCNVCSYAYF